jgi:hypothetical protein
MDRLMGCGPPALPTSRNLLLSVRLVCCSPPVGLSSSVKDSVNDGLRGVGHQILDLVLNAPLRRCILGRPSEHFQTVETRSSASGPP